MAFNKKTALLGLGLLASLGQVAALDVSVDSSGLMIGSKADPYWFSMGGVVKLDQRIYFGSGKKSDEFSSRYNSGANVRALSLDMEGGIGRENFDYNIGLDFDPNASKVDLDSAYLNYHYQDNWTFSVGHLHSVYCSDSSASGKALAFMERSMTTTTFAPCAGLGVKANNWADNYSLNLVVSQPKSGVDSKNRQGEKVSDRWQAIGRASYAPYLNGDKVVQLSAGVYFKDLNNADKTYKTHPETGSGRSNVHFLNTGTIPARNETNFNVELAGQNGPLYGELEYSQSKLRRAITEGSDTRPAALSFSGYHAQVSYVLSGESRSRNIKNGTFGYIEPNSSGGAYEVSVRFSHINLNDQEIRGGKASNVTTSLGWTASKNLRMIGEYTRSHMKKERADASLTEKKKLNSIGARLQLVF